MSKQKLPRLVLPRTMFLDHAYFAAYWADEVRCAGLLVNSSAELLSLPSVGLVISVFMRSWCSRAFVVLLACSTRVCARTWTARRRTATTLR